MFARKAYSSHKTPMPDCMSKALCRHDRVINFDLPSGREGDAIATTLFGQRVPVCVVTFLKQRIMLNMSRDAPR